MHHRSRRIFFRRAILGAVVLVVFAAFGAVALVSSVASSLGLPAWAAPVSILAFAFTATLVLLRVFGAMRRFASPLAAVMDAADRVANGDRGVRVREYGPPPLRALARSFNAMTDRLDRADRQRRELMADVAHELRTPLSVLQGRLEGLIDGVYVRDDQQLAELLDDTRVLSRLIDDLRTLALSEAGAIELHRESTDLSELLHDVIRGMQVETGQHTASLTIVGPDVPVVLDIDPVRLRQVFTNIVANALRHTPADGIVTITIGADREHVTVIVADTGAGMTHEEAARMFDRFYKGKESRGSGLGLTIARSLVAAHEGAITATSRPGEGTRVIVKLPATAESR